MHYVSHNVNDAYAEIMTEIPVILSIDGAKPSRNGPTIEFRDPVTTTYQFPIQRILWDKKRDANPFFHLIESLWMLAGRNDVKFLTDVLPKMGEFSDDGAVFNAAYGYRWRHYFGIDQLHEIVRMLVEDPMTRRVVLQIWSFDDLGKISKDLPCNIAATFSTRSGYLDMTVFNRSNDIILGAYGANVVHFSFLQEYIAGRIGRMVGRYSQISTNFHAYVETFDKMKNEKYGEDLYSCMGGGKDLIICPLMTKGQEHNFDEDVRQYCEIDNYLTGGSYDNSFFNKVAIPMRFCYKMWRDGHKAEARGTLQAYLEKYGNIDWFVAGLRWMDRRWMGRCLEKKS